MPRPVLSLLLLACLTFVVGLGRPAITDSDEAFYAEASREMVERGDWLTPHFNYEFRWQKPVLYYWLTAATYLVTGPSEWSARFWSALSGVGLVLLTWSIARTQTRDDRIAWLAGAIVATCFGYFAESRLALPDMPLTFCITLTIWALCRTTVIDPPTEAREERLMAVPASSVFWWALAGAAAGLGFLLKGPVSLVVPAVVMLPVWWRERAWHHLRLRHIVIAGAVFVILALPWYAAMVAEHGVAYLQSFFLQDNIERFTTDRYQPSTRPFWFYGPIVLGGLMPWTAYFVACTAAGAARLWRGATLSAAEWRLLLWAGMPLLFYTLSIGKQPRYILPVLPPLAVLLAASLEARLRTADDTGRAAFLRAATVATAGILAILAILLFRARAIFIAAYPAATAMAVAALLASAGGLSLMAFTRSWRKLPAILAVIATVVLLSVQFAALSGRRPEAVEAMAALIRAHRPGEGPVGVYHVFVRNLPFYTQSARVELFDDPSVVNFLRSAQPVLLVIRASDLTRVQEASGVPTRTLGRVPYLNTADLRLRTLLDPEATESVQHVLLVTNQP